MLLGGVLDLLVGLVELAPVLGIFLLRATMRGGYSSSTFLISSSCLRGSTQLDRVLLVGLLPLLLVALLEFGDAASHLLFGILHLLGPASPRAL